MALSRGSKWFLAVMAMVLAVGAAGLWWIDGNWFADDLEPGVAVTYTVERGASVRAVGEDLADLGVLRSSVRFRISAEDAGLETSLQPGAFELETGMEVDEVIGVLASGPVAPPTVRFTVPEGLTVEQTLERLAEQFDDHSVDDFARVLDERTDAGRNGGGVLRTPEWIQEPAERGEGVDPYEGMLWPQTYEIDDDATPLTILQMMVDQLDTEMAAVIAEQDEPVEPSEAYTRLITASLIERETRVDDERRLVAGVIANRLADGMRLQIDASVVYALGGNPTDIVSLDDLEVDSPYNTYRIDGLPPGPISGLGTAALRAAFAPADVPYRFYVLDPSCDGTHRFAETDEEHERNVAAFRDAGRCLELEEDAS